jgi:hypothetical protein
MSQDADRHTYVDNAQALFKGSAVDATTTAVLGMLLIIIGMLALIHERLGSK